MRPLVDRIWPLTVAAAAFLTANWESIYNLIQGELSAAGNKFDAKTLIFILAGLITMFNVWSKESAQRLALSNPHVLERKRIGHQD